MPAAQAAGMSCLKILYVRVNSGYDSEMKRLYAVIIGQSAEEHYKNNSFRSPPGLVILSLLSYEVGGYQAFQYHCQSIPSLLGVAHKISRATQGGYRSNLNT
jgi:hypothetical protein